MWMFALLKFSENISEGQMEIKHIAWWPVDAFTIGGIFERIFPPEKVLLNGKFLFVE